MITKKRVSYKMIVSSIFLIFLAIGAIGFLAITNWRINQKRGDLQQRIEVLEKEIQILKEKTAALRAGLYQTKEEDYQVKRLYEQGYFEKGAIPVIVLPIEENEEKEGKEIEKEEKSLWGPRDWWEWLEKIRKR